MMISYYLVKVWSRQAKVKATPKCAPTKHSKKFDDPFKQRAAKFKFKLCPCLRIKEELSLGRNPSASHINLLVKPIVYLINLLNREQIMLLQTVWYIWKGWNFIFPRGKEVVHVKINVFISLFGRHCETRYTDRVQKVSVNLDTFPSLPALITSNYRFKLDTLPALSLKKWKHCFSILLDFTFASDLS